MMKKMENWGFEYEPRLYLQFFFSSSRKSCKIEIFEVFLISYFLPDCEDSLSGTV